MTRGSVPAAMRGPLRAVDHAAGLCLVMSGQVHNRTELRAKLEGHGARLRTDGDEELVLRAYERWAEGCTTRIIGECSFAIWDEANRQLFCGRDRLGVKPFHYWHSGATFVFASDIRQVVDRLQYSPGVNDTALGLLLVDSCEEVEQTLYKDVCRLPPAHCLTLTTSGLRKTRYWTLDPPPVLRWASDDQYAEHFSSVFQEAVRCRLDGSRRSGVLLSGGLDSSSVTCVARAVTSAASVATFSLLFDDPVCDERRYIRELADVPGAANEFYPERADAAGLDFDGDEPHPRGALYYPNLSMLRQPLEAARQAGIAVVLTGLGADDLFTGYHHCADLLRCGRWLSLARELQSLRRLTGLRLRDRLMMFGVRPLVPDAIRRVRGARVPSWIRADFARRSGLLDRLQAARPPARFPDAGRQVLYQTLFESGAYPFAFEEECRFSQGASVECRAPFLDLRLIEFALALPPEQRTWRGETKIVLRNGMKGILPDAIRLRSDKADFSPFVDRELRVRQRARIDRVFATSRLAEAGVVDGHEIRARWRRYCDQGGGARWTILTLLNMERSLRALHSPTEVSGGEAKPGTTYTREVRNPTSTLSAALPH